MADLPISTIACAHAHLDPIMAVIRETFPEATAQIDPGVDLYRSEIRVTIGEDVYGLLVIADFLTTGYGSNQKNTLKGFSIGKGTNTSYYIGTSRRFVLRKNGTFDYLGVAALVVGAKNADIRTREAAARHAANTAATAEVFSRIKHLLLPGSSVSVRSKPGAPLELNIGLRVEVSADDALELARRIHDWQNNYRKD